MSEHELDRLDSDKLIAYIRSADAAGDARAAHTALAVLVFRHYPDVLRRVRIRVPGADCEDVAQEVMFSAIRSAFDQASYGQFRSWLNTITARRIADYTERNTRRREHETSLPEEHSEAEEIWGEAAVTPDEGSTIAVEEIHEQVMSSRNEIHRAVIEHYVFEDQDAESSADLINEEFSSELSKPMSVDNVHKIVSRYRKDMREALGDSDH